MSPHPRLALEPVFTTPNSKNCLYGGDAFSFLVGCLGYTYHTRQGQIDTVSGRQAPNHR